MLDGYFLGADSLSEIVTYCGEYVAAGVGMGFIAYALGVGFRAVVSWLRVI